MGMEFALAIRKLLRHKLAIAIGVLVAGAAGILSVYNLNGTSLVAKTGVQHSTASTQVLVDAPSSALADLASQGAGTPLQSLATTLANFAPSQAVLNLIGPAAGLTGGQLYAEGPVSQNLPRTVQEPTDLQRNIQISGEAAPFRLQFNSDPNLPEIGIYAQAPTTAEAIRLANAAVTGLTEYLTQLQQAEKVSASNRVVLRPLGQATGGVDAPSASKTLGLMAFLGVFVLWCAMILVGERLLATWRISATYAPAGTPPAGTPPAGTPPAGTPRSRERLRTKKRESRAVKRSANGATSAEPLDEDFAAEHNGFAEELGHARLASVVARAETADDSD
jgi:hypothetical protein